MSWEIIAKILEIQPSNEFTSEMKFTAIAYANFARPDGSNVFPSVSTIAKITGYGERSVQRYKAALVSFGLLIPDGKGRHGTDKFRMPINSNRYATVTPLEFGGGDSPSGDNPSGVTVAHDPNEPFNTATAAAVFKMFQEEITKITPLLKKDLQAFLLKYPHDWILEAIQIAARQSVRKINYISSILQRWEAEGKDDGKKPRKDQQKKGRDESRPEYRKLPTAAEEEATGNYLKTPPKRVDPEIAERIRQREKEKAAQIELERQLQAAAQVTAIAEASRGKFMTLREWKEKQAQAAQTLAAA